MKTKLEEVGIKVAWTATDGFSSSNKFISRTNIPHFFDYVHLVKLGRNSLLIRTLSRNRVKFSMKKLEELWLKNSTLQAVFSDQALHPSDRQNIKPVFELTSTSSINALQSEALLDEENSSFFRELAEYATILSQLYDLTSQQTL